MEQELKYTFGFVFSSKLDDVDDNDDEIVMTTNNNNDSVDINPTTNT